MEEEEEEEGRVGVMKPDIVFFGEGLPDSFHEQLQKDKKKVIEWVWQWAWPNTLPI